MPKKQARQQIEQSPNFHKLSAFDQFAAKSEGYGDAEQAAFTSDSRAIDRDRSERVARKRRTLKLAGKSALAVAGLTVATGIAGVIGARDLANQRDIQSSYASATYNNDSHAGIAQPVETAAQTNEEHRRHEAVVQHSAEPK